MMQVQEIKRIPSYMLIPGIANRTSRHVYSIDEIIEYVCTKMNVPVQKVLSRSREHQYIFPRQVISYACNKIVSPKFSLHEIGRKIKRDHATVLYGCLKVKGFLDVKCEQGKIIEDVIKKFK